MTVNTTKDIKRIAYETLLSTRRIFHISMDHEIFEKEGYFEDTYFSGYGTGVLLRFKNKLFLITAKHVLKDYLVDNPVNPSPFRVQLDVTKGFDGVDDFLYPKKIWDIGQLISCDDSYEYEDIVLVEMHDLMPDQTISHFIDLDKVDFMKLSDFKVGLNLIECGYSIESNAYYYESKNTIRPFDENKYSSSTNIKRDFLFGVLCFEKDRFYFHKTKCEIKNTNGMSGSLIICIDNDVVKLLGIHVRSSKESNKINFVPIEKIINSIIEYDKSKSYIIDFSYYERLSNSENLLSVIDFMPDELKDKFFSLGLNNDEIDELMIINEFCDFIINSRNFFINNYKESDSVNGDNYKEKFFHKILDITYEIKENISKKISGD